MDEERKQIEMLEKQLRAMQEDLEDTVRKFDRRIRALEQQNRSSDNNFGDTEV